MAWLWGLVGTPNLRAEQSSVFPACGSRMDSPTHWTPPSFKGFSAQWGQLTEFPWDCVFPTATQAPGQPPGQPHAGLPVNVTLWGLVKG